MSDLIDREALRAAMYEAAFETDSDEQKWDSGCWIRYKMFERVVDSLPSVPASEEPEVFGHWIEDGYQDEPCVCSHCGVPGSEEFTYCPHCGVKMLRRVK